MTPIAFAHDLRFADLPAPVVGRAKHCLLDLLGVAASGTGTELSRVARNHAARHMGASTGGASILFDGRHVSVAGAAFAGASTIDSFDAHDGHALTKGHAGVAILPSLLAFAEEIRLEDGQEILTCLVVGYEIATRAGIALHGSVADYHTSGAWNALGCAAVGARLLGLDATATRHAVGIAEFNGPRSQMMRCIEDPTMVKDGSGWGAFAGVTAAYLAQAGFSGAPAITIEAQEHADLWGDLGRRWTIMEQYFKPHPVCRWAQPAIEAAVGIVARHGIVPEQIEAVEIATFGHAVALGTRLPETTEEAQYAIGFPVACALTKGRVGPAEISPAGLRDPETIAMLGRISLFERPEFSARFPAERLAVVCVKLRDGRSLTSPPTRPRGDPENFLPDEEIRSKFLALAAAMPHEDRGAVERAVEEIDRASNAVGRLIGLVTRPLSA